MVQIRNILSVLSVAVAASAVPVKRWDSSSSGYSSGDSQPAYGGDSSYMTTSAMAEKAMETSSSMMMEESSSMMKESTSSMMAESTSTMMMESTSTMSTEAAKATSAMTYGSGSWDKSGYDGCVSQCMSQFGGGSAMTYTPPSSNSTETTMGSGGDANGATHTVIVAPSQGVLRYVPAFVNAQPGDTVMFKWGANNHTVTKGSALLPCNKTSDAPFASGTQNKDFTFMQKVNDTSPTYFYCATAGHCQKGMFGMINPPMATGSNSSSSAGSWMPAHFSNSSSSSNSSAPSSNSTMSSGNSTMSSMSSSSDISSYWSYTQQMTQNNAAAASWGSNVDMSAVPDWAKEDLAANIMYTRNLMAMNPDVVDSQGQVSISTDAPLMLPNDVAAVNNAGASSSDASAASASGAAAPAASSAAAETPAGAAAQPSNGAGALASSKVVMGAAVVLATFFLL